ncbi:hypothetical protein [Microbulbifer sp. PAAF003]|uniref:hypothetical protein n=1 Tax=Microbulbifer sp. PAAF003 TaxID=3243375 RepID=UPI004039B404
MNKIFLVILITFSSLTVAETAVPVEYIFIESWRSRLPDQVYIDEFGSIKVVELCPNDKELVVKLKLEGSFDELNGKVYKLYSVLRKNDLKIQIEELDSNSFEVCPHCEGMNLKISGKYFTESANIDHRAPEDVKVKLVELINNSLNRSKYKGCSE